MSDNYIEDGIRDNAGHLALAGALMAHSQRRQQLQSLEASRQHQAQIARTEAERLEVEKQRLKIEKLRQRIEKDEKKAAQAEKEAVRLLRVLMADLAQWIRLQEAKFSNQSRELYARILEIDSTWQHEQARLEALSLDLEISEKMDSLSGILPAHRPVIKAICDHLTSLSRRSQLGGTRIPSLQQISELLEYYQLQANKAPRRQQRYYQHITLRFQQVWQQLENNLAS